MREIKFRAWDMKKKQMLKIFDSSVGVDWYLPSWKENYKVMQYTGLTDKNGTEIYESDILECIDLDGEKYVTEVKFDDGAFYIEVNGCDYDYTAIGWAIGHDIDECCVIGNIYEDAELLK